MIAPRRSKSGSIVVRKGIPEDVRAEYLRLYGLSWEAKLTIPPSVSAAKAKLLISEFSAEHESRIAAIRAAQHGEGRSLTQRQAFALAGEWYSWFVAQREENPGPVEHWRMMWGVLLERLEDHAPNWVIEQGWRDLEWTREPEVRAGIAPSSLMKPRRRSSSHQNASFEPRGPSAVPRLRVGRVHRRNPATRAACQQGL